jgi:hypothetical protein
MAVKVVSLTLSSLEGSGYVSKVTFSVKVQDMSVKFLRIHEVSKVTFPVLP